MLVFFVGWRTGEGLGGAAAAGRAILWGMLVGRPGEGRGGVAVSLRDRVGRPEPIDLVRVLANVVDPPNDTPSPVGPGVVRVGIPGALGLLNVGPGAVWLGGEAILGERESINGVDGADAVPEGCLLACDTGGGLCGAAAAGRSAIIFPLTFSFTRMVESEDAEVVDSRTVSKETSTLAMLLFRPRPSGRPGLELMLLIMADGPGE